METGLERSVKTAFKFNSFKTCLQKSLKIGLKPGFKTCFKTSLKPGFRHFQWQT